MKCKGWLIAGAVLGLAAGPALTADRGMGPGAKNALVAQADEVPPAEAQGEAQTPSLTGAHPPELVVAVQRALKDEGYDAGPEDGILGPRTERALRNFQQSSGLQPSGDLDAQTLSALGLEREAAEFAAGEGRSGGGAAQPEAGGQAP